MTKDTHVLHDVTIRYTHDGRRWVLYTQHYAATASEAISLVLGEHGLGAAQVKWSEAKEASGMHDGYCVECVEVAG